MDGDDAFTLGVQSNPIITGDILVVLPADVLTTGFLHIVDIAVIASVDSPAGCRSSPNCLGPLLIPPGIPMADTPFV